MAKRRERNKGAAGPSARRSKRIKTNDEKAAKEKKRKEEEQQQREEEERQRREEAQERRKQAAAAAASRKSKEAQKKPKKGGKNSVSRKKKKKKSKEKSSSGLSDGGMLLPSRNKHGELVFKDHPEFRPNLTPQQVLQAGAFGGSYFRTIRSSVTGTTLKGASQIKEFPKDWFEGLDIKKQVCSSVYDPSVNRYGVRCGGGLDMWEGSGWIAEQDPYGWFQWYCRFYLGRRTDDDARQISRGLGVFGPKGRWRNNLIGRCVRSNKAFDDYSVSPVVRQALMHWGYHLTERDANKYVKLKRFPCLPEPLNVSPDSRHKPKSKQPLFDPNTMQRLGR
eukprot:jgi/Bigna1/83907/fgenesh1_pg.118_\